MKQLGVLTIVFFVLRGTYLNAQIYQEINIMKRTELIDNTDTKLFVTIYPNTGKETIILLHGGPGFPDDLKEVAETFASKYQAISFHQRGTKKSPCKSDDYSIERYISDIDCVAEYFQIEKFHLFGHSWGGVYAQVYAQKRPDNLLSLFLCNPGSGTGAEWKQTENEVMQFNKSKTSAGEWMKMGLNSILGMFGIDNAYKNLFKQVMKNYNADFSESHFSDINYDNITASPINKTRGEIEKYPVLAQMPKPGFKVSIVYGDRDIYQSSKDFVTNRYPTAKVYSVENCGHLPWLHNPQKFTQILAEHFLKKRIDYHTC
jgi:pimeloyl-ACP methyl ester carboxylesterase